MYRIQRKTSPKVIGGKPQRKNYWGETSDYYNTAPINLIVDRKRPGTGYRHLLKRKDIFDFIELLPNWRELSKGLNAIVLEKGSYWSYGYYVPGVVHVCAWDIDLWLTLSVEGYEQEKEFLHKAGVPFEKQEDEYICKFTESTARAHQLLVTLLHELGHHHDRLTTKRQNLANRGENYAEEYAKVYGNQIWERYMEVFGLL